MSVRIAILLWTALTTYTASAASPAGSIVLPLFRDSGLDAYYAELFVGTPPQRNILKVDSGSPMYGFIDPRNPVCNRSDKPCTADAVFDNTTSSTCFYQRPGFTNFLANVGQGDYLNDTIAFADVTVEHLSFGYISSFGQPSYVTAPLRNVVGFSLDCQFGGPSCIGQGGYFLPQLRNASVINHIASSWYLSTDDLEKENPYVILGGFYDQSKVSGTQFTLQMVDPFNAALTGSQTNSVNVTGMKVVSDSNTTSGTYGNPGEGVPVLLDNGVASFYMPQNIFDAFYAGVGGDPSKVQLGDQHPVVDCSYRDASTSSGYVEVEFSATGSIQVPFHAMVSQLADGTCATFAGGRGPYPSIFGDTFLRSVYLILDQENFTVTLSQVQHTLEQNIVPFPEGGFKVGKNN
ncbi:hypothetical protein CERZMDRAFT_52295 [Cercospora zeae-maydis SCOH1-5]|uniref:Peptidase A1 domain-containing protein n=1 Tax=Cercospora zeae-maydis SCOH1-5 TaxID=717836 RepID=A0A6A6EXG9_9PEZI|nr:hypothetical protein CERZMDRAFT_52295 [Cercospora zeae-maydis SCOH1-5]